MNPKQLTSTSSDCPPPYVAKVEPDNKSNSVLALFLLAGPLPFLYSLNSLLSFWSLDSFHYVLFQALFVALCPTLMQAKVKVPKFVGSSNKTEFSTEKIPLETEKVLKIENSKESSISSIPKNHLQFDSLKVGNHSRSHRFSNDSEILFEDIHTILNSSAQEDPATWELIIETCDPLPLSIFRDKNSDHRYRLDCSFNNSPATVFDSLSFNEDSASSEATKKVLKMKEKLEVLDANASLLYFRTISVWPTSARDMCLLQNSRVLPDGSILSVCKSVSHSSKPENSISSVVRMDVLLAGRWFRPVPNNPNICKMMCYFHGDPKGWIPKSVVNLAATKFIPKVLYQINKHAEQLPYKELPQSISNYSPGAGSSTAASGSTICEDDIPEPLSISEIKPTEQNESVISIDSNPNENKVRVTISQTLAPPPTFWERLQVNFTPSLFTRQLVIATGPVILTAAVVAVIVRRNQS